MRGVASLGNSTSSFSEALCMHHTFPSSFSLWSSEEELSARRRREEEKEEEKKRRRRGGGEGEEGERNRQREGEEEEKKKRSRRRRRAVSEDASQRQGRVTHCRGRTSLSTVCSHFGSVASNEGACDCQKGCVRWAMTGQQPQTTLHSSKHALTSSFCNVPSS